MKQRLNVCVLTGAGMSAESGIKTFRDADGLWEGHDVMKVASPQGWHADMDLVLDFYNLRRKQLLEVTPNIGHIEIAQLEDHHNVTVITQNVDDLHERAGSSEIIHLHGELLKVRSTGDEKHVITCTGDIKRHDLCPKGHQLRPHIVWFGEAVPMLEKAMVKVMHANVILIVGTSMQVYPAASLAAYADPNVPILYVDPNPTINHELSRVQNLKIFKGPATTEIKKAIAFINDYHL